MQKKLVLLIPLFILICVGGYFLYQLLFPKPQAQSIIQKEFSKTTVTPTLVPRVYHPLTLSRIPLVGSSSAVVDLESEVIKSSILEKEKLLLFLPYRKDIHMGVRTITLLVPEVALQDAYWALNVYIDGIDYQAGSDDEKKVFLSAAKLIYSWMVSHRVDPNKLIIVWGDKAYIREKIDNWLTAQ
jgi:hypothetical protein